MKHYITTHYNTTDFTIVKCSTVRYYVGDYRKVGFQQYHIFNHGKLRYLKHRRTL